METQPLDRQISVCPKLTDSSYLTRASVRHVLDSIRSDRWRAQIEALRQLPASERGAAKRELPAVLFSGAFTERKLDGLEAHSGVICLDFDGLPDCAAARASIEADAHVLACFVSPSGNGLKVLIPVAPIPQSAAEHEMAWRVCAARAESAWGLSVDASGKDVSRLCFVSHDPQLHVNAAAQPLSVDYDSPAPESDFNTPNKRRDDGERESCDSAELERWLDPLLCAPLNPLEDVDRVIIGAIVKERNTRYSVAIPKLAMGLRAIGQ
jgi:hypothetical protein